MRRLTCRFHERFTGQVFISDWATARTATWIASVVRRAFVAAGVRTCAGPHLLRHSLASELLHAGANLSEVGQVLGHLQHATTEIYAKVRVDALRELAFPWPKAGGEA